MLDHLLQDSPVNVLGKLTLLMERRHASRKLKRQAAIALLQLCRAAQAKLQSERTQQALARSLAFALPRRLSEPRVVHGLMSGEECAELISIAATQGAVRGWSSLHRRYSTCDMPVEHLPNCDTVYRTMRDRTLPHFRTFGRRYSSSASGALEFVSLFVVRYSAVEEGAQTGLSGHLDESLVSFVLSLSDESAYTGGGTRFEHCSGNGNIFKPGRGSAVLFLGKIWHEAVPISAGERYVLVGLLNRARDAP